MTEGGEEQSPQPEEDVSSTVTRKTVDSEDLASTAYYLSERASKPRDRFFKCPGWRRRQNYSFSNDNVSTIDRENRRLLGQLWRACGSNNAGKPPRVLKLYHSGLNRQRANQRIETENLATLKRLESVKSSRFVKCSDQLEDYQRLAAYPGTPSLAKYKLSESSKNATRRVAASKSRDPAERKSLARSLIEAKERENKRLHEQNKKLFAMRRGQHYDGSEDGTEEDGTADGSESPGFFERVKRMILGWFGKGESSEDTGDSVSSTDVTKGSSVQEADDLQKQQLEFDKSSDMTQKSIVRRGSGGDMSYGALGTPDDEYGEYEEDQQSALDIYTLGLKKRKNYSFPANDAYRINQENMRLLREISRTHCMPRPVSSVYWNATYESKTTPILEVYHSGRNRKWAQQRIDTENLHVLKRVESVKSTPDIKRSQQLKNYHRLASYPGTQSLCRYDESMLEPAPSPTSKSGKVRVPRPDWTDRLDD